jgi:peptide/nickel transport system substrate-binding protein
VPGALTGCSGSAAGQVDYIVDGALDTYNTNTVSGAASAGAQAFARTLTGFGYHGPDGQVVADHDFGAISIVGGSPLVLDYQIADNAVYSDGKPVTCDDLVLAWAAQSGRYSAFDAASQAGYVDVTAIDCQPGQKKARVSFAPDRNIVDYNQLFTATAILPSHVIAEELGIDVTGALLGNDVPAIGRIAQLWNTTWSLKPGIDPGTIGKHFPSSGPYKIESVLDGGGVVLVANDRWWGAESRHPGPGQRQERRRRRRRGGLLGCAGHARQLPPHRCAVGRYRAADFRTARAARRRPCAPRTRVVHTA